MDKKVILITFETITDAMAMEGAVNEAKLSGKLIPIPDELSAGCGYAWRHALEEREALEKLIEEKALDYEAMMEWER